jgi:hypothetical protein
MRQTGHGCLCDLAYAVIFGLGAALGRSIFRALASGWREPGVRIVMGALIVALAAPAAWAAALTGPSVALWAVVWAVASVGGWHGLTGGLWAVASPAVTGTRWAAAVRAGGYAVLAAPGLWGVALLAGLPAWAAAAAMAVVVTGIAAVSLHGLAGGSRGYAPRLGAARWRLR